MKFQMYGAEEITGNYQMAHTFFEEEKKNLIVFH